MRTSAKTLAINAAVVTALVGGGVAYITLDHAVVLSVDGETETVHTFGSSVEDVLDDQGIEVGEHDEVIPSLNSEIEDGTEISVRYGREVTITVDGEQQEIWTTALSVDEALADLDIRHDGADISVARSQSIGRDGIDIEVRTPKAITLVADGASTPVRTTALTVRESLDEAGVTLGELDRVTPALETPLASALTVTVNRVSVDTATVTAALPFETTEEEDDTLPEGEGEIVTEGVEGSVERVIERTLVDGVVESENVISETVLSEPVDEVIKIGTMEPEIDTSVDGGVWDQLAGCESGGDWAANTGNGYYGGVQFSLGTWRAFGGSGYPHENSKAEQIRIAEKVLANAGGSFRDWPGCRAKLGLP